MKRLQHAQPPTPEKSKQSIRDCEDLVGQCPLDYPNMLANAAGNIQHTDAAYTGGSVSS